MGARVIRRGKGLPGSKKAKLQKKKRPPRIHSGADVSEKPGMVFQDLLIELIFKT
jgi:hypothetical protein